MSEPRTATGRRIDAAFRAAYERGDRSASWEDARSWILAIEAEAAGESRAVELLRRAVGSHRSHESAYWSGCDACHALTEARAFLADTAAPAESYTTPAYIPRVEDIVGGSVQSSEGSRPLTLDEMPAGAALPPSDPPALDVPPEAIEWARELVRQGYRDEHIVTFSEDGYGLKHPIRCRPNLIGCMFNEWLHTEMAPDRDPGRYLMTWAKQGPKYARLSAQPEVGADDQPG